MAKSRSVLFLVALYLGGCSSWFRADFDPVTYEGAITHTSGLDAHVRMNTGDVTGYPPSTMIFVSPGFKPRIYETEAKSGFYPWTPAPHYSFGRADQEVFLKSLKSELLKHGVVKTVNEIKQGEGLEVIVNFIETECTEFPGWECRIEALLLLKSGANTYHEIYSVRSYQGESTFLAASFLSKAKSRVAEKLLAAVIPDIETFISALPE